MATTTFLLAGCSDSDEDGPSDGGETTTEEATTTDADGRQQRITGSGQFGVSDLTFCAEQPSGYDDYVEQADGIYEPYETIWLYFDVDGATATLQNGEYVVDITQQLGVTAPDGETVIDDTHEFVEPVEDIDEYHGWNRLSLASDAPAGEYDVSVDMTDNHAGESTTATTTFHLQRGDVTTDEPFAVEEFVFCSEPPVGHDDYVEQEGATYPQGESVWMYADFTGINYTATSTGQEVQIDGYLKVTNPDGVVALEENYEYSDSTDQERGAQTFFVSEDVVLASDATTGDYAVEFRFTETISGEQDTVTRSFTAEENE